MKNLNLIFATVLFALFTLTSCEKENLSELNTTETTNLERTLPAEGIYSVNKDAKTFATKETITQMANSRTNGFEHIYDLSRSLHRTTIGQGNTFNSYNSPCLSSGQESFDGHDAAFYFEVEFDPGFLPDVDITYEVVLSNLHTDLDLFVYTLDAHNRIDQCLGRSMHHYNVDEKIQLGELGKGYYIIVVDGWDRSVAGNFTLKVNKKEDFTFKPGDGGPNNDGPVNPPVAGANDMTNATFIDFLGGHADTHDGGWVIVRGNDLEFFEDYSATPNVLTLTSHKVEGGKTTDIKVTFNKSTKWVKSETKWRTQYAAGSSSWSASIRDISYGN